MDDDEEEYVYVYGSCFSCHYMTLISVKLLLSDCMKNFFHV